MGDVWAFPEPWSSQQQPLPRPPSHLPRLSSDTTTSHGDTTFLWLALCFLSPYRVRNLLWAPVVPGLSSQPDCSGVRSVSLPQLLRGTGFALASVLSGAPSVSAQAMPGWGLWGMH